MEGKPQSNNPPDRFSAGEMSAAVATQERQRDPLTLGSSSDDLVSDSRKRKRQGAAAESSQEEPPQQQNQQQQRRNNDILPAPMILPNDVTNRKQWNNDFSRSNQQFNAGFGPGIPHLSQQLRAPSSLTTQSLGNMSSNNGTANQAHSMSFQAPPPPQMQQPQEQQLGFNIFGLNPVQIQQLLMLQMQQQMRGIVGNGSQMGDLNSPSGSFNQSGLLLSPQQQLGNHNLFLGGMQNPVNPGLSSMASLQPIQPANANTASAANADSNRSSLQNQSMTQSSVQVTQNTSASAATSGTGATGGGGATQSSEDSRLSGRSAIALYMSCDDEALSEYQCLVRKNIELFEATQVDVESNAQGRNKPIVLGQVGIRCRHCTMLPPKNRSRGAMYYPAKLDGLYQAAQNQAKGHLTKHCRHIPPQIRSELIRLNDHKSSAGGGKKYWGDGVRVLGVYEDEHGLRFEKRR